MASTMNFVFVHGINNSLAERSALPVYISERLTTFHLRHLYNEVSAATWNSSGSFFGDLRMLAEDMSARDAAIHAVQESIQNASASCDVLVIMPHSMGQPLAVAALEKIERLNCNKAVLVTIGGPLGNSDPAFKLYFQRWPLPSGRPKNVDVWIDFFNPEDPICHHPILGSSAIKGSMHVPFRMNKPAPMSPLKPLAAHSTYFEKAECFTIATRLGLDRLRA